MAPWNSPAARLAAVVCALALAASLLPLPPPAGDGLVPVAEAQRGRRKFITLPIVNTYSALNLPGATTTVTSTLRRNDGSTAQLSADTLPPETVRLYGAPAGFSGAASIEAAGPLSVANFSLDASGNDAYLGPSEEQAALGELAQPGPVPFFFTLPYVRWGPDGWITLVSIQNLGTSVGDMSLDFYDQSGALVAVIIDTLAPGGSKTFLLPGGRPGFPPGFVGTVIISSSQPLNLANGVRIFNPARGVSATYAPTLNQDTASTLVAPALFAGHEGQTSLLCVQNVGFATTNMTVRYADSITSTATLPSGAHRCLDQGAEPHPPGWTGGATITAGGPISGVVFTTAQSNGLITGAWAYTPRPLTSGPGTYALPLLLNADQDMRGEVFLYNPGPAAAQVATRFVSDQGYSICGATLSLAAGASRAIASDELPPLLRTGAAYVVSSAPLAVAAAMTSTRPPGDTDRHLGYEADPGEPVALPPGCLAELPGSGPADPEYRIFQSYYEQIGVAALWRRGITGPTARPITVAVIDTGVDLDHPDLLANLLPGYDFADEDPTPQDSSSDSHGSMVAGVIAAPMNGLGVVGVGGGDAAAGAPGLRILPIRIAAETGGFACEVTARAIDYAVTQGAHIINMSYSGDESCEEELAAIERAYAAGVALVAGAGNTGAGAPQYPAAYGTGENERLVIAVAGLLSSGAKAPDSSYGPWVDVSAPYGSIRSTNRFGAYATAGGTSFSAALVSGALGVLMGHYGWERDRAVAALLSYADQIDSQNPGYVGQLGAGRLNADRATQTEAQAGRLYLPLVARGD